MGYIKFYKVIKKQIKGQNFLQIFSGRMLFFFSAEKILEIAFFSVRPLFRHLISSSLFMKKCFNENKGTVSIYIAFFSLVFCVLLRSISNLLYTFIYYLSKNYT